MLQGLWQSHYEILLINSLKEVVKLNVNSDTMIKNAEIAELNISTATVFLDT